METRVSLKYFVNDCRNRSNNKKEKLKLLEELQIEIDTKLKKKRK